MSEFNALVRAARSGSGLSVRSLADLVNKNGITTVTGSMISAIEMGKPCSFRLAVALADVLNLDTQKVLEAAFLARVRYAVERERHSLEECLSTLPGGRKLDVEKITRLPSRLE